MITVSVCIQTYNQEPYIAQALDSVLMQETDFKYEIILGEDESQDGTREICIEYARQQPDRIRLFLRSRKDVIYINRRPTGRFNLVENLKAARGKYIALLEGDDYWTDPLKLQKQVDFLEANPDYTACFHHIYKFFQSTGKMEIEEQIWPRSYYILPDFIRQKVHVPTPSLMLRNGLISEFPSWFFEAPVGDIPLIFLYAQMGKIGLIDQVMAVYRFHGGGIWQGADEWTRTEINYQTIVILRKHLGPQYEKLFNIALANNQLNQSRLYAERGNIVNAKICIKKSISVSFTPQGKWIDQIVMLGRLYFPRFYELSKWIQRRVTNLSPRIEK